MNVMNAFRRGLNLVAEHIKIVPIIYAINLTVAAVLAVPMFATLDGALSHRAANETMMQGFDHTWWSEFSFHADSFEKTFRPSLSSGFGPLFDNLELLLTGRFTNFGIWIFVLGLAYLMLVAFTNGGVIGTFIDEKRTFSVRRFFATSGYFFHHFFALALTAVLVFFLVYKFVSSFIFGIVDAVTASWVSEPAIWFLNLGGYLLLLVLVVFINMIFDYAKIIIVSEEKESSWLCIWLALKFAVPHLFKTSGLYYLLSGLGVLLVVVFGLLLTWIPSGTVFMLILAILVQQTFILAKIALRLSFYGAQLVLYQQHQEQTTVRKKRKL